jgi:hypothetical protein
MSNKLLSFAERVGSTFVFSAVGAVSAFSFTGTGGVKELAAVGVAAVVAGVQSVVKFLAVQATTADPEVAPAVADVESIADAAVTRLADKLK